MPDASLRPSGVSTPSDHTAASPRLLAPRGDVPPANGKLEFRWQEVADTSGYWLEIAGDAAFSDLVFDTFIGRGDRLSIALPVSEPSRELFWRMRSRSDSGWGAFSEPVPFRPGVEAAPVEGARAVTAPVIEAPAQPDSAPSEAQPLQPAGGVPADSAALVLSWSPKPGARNYRVQVAAEERFERLMFDAPVGARTDVTLYDLLPENGRTFYWRVSAQPDHGDAAWSEAARFKSASIEEVQGHERAQYEAAVQARRREGVRHEAAPEPLGAEGLTSNRLVSATLAVMLISFIIMVAATFILATGI